MQGGRDSSVIPPIVIVLELELVLGSIVIEQQQAFDGKNRLYRLARRSQTEVEVEDD